MIFLTISSYLALAVVLLALVASCLQFTPAYRTGDTIERVCGRLMIPVVVLFVVGCLALVL